MCERCVGEWLQHPVSLYWDPAREKHWCCPARAQDHMCFPWVYIQDLESCINAQPDSQDVTTPTQQVTSDDKKTQAGAASGFIPHLHDRRCVQLGQPQPLPVPHLHQYPVQVPQARLQLSTVPHRPTHAHPAYGNGQYLQQPIMWAAAASGIITPRCNHPSWNWNGDPWWNPHGEGLQLHCWNIKDMHMHCNRQSLETLLFTNNSLCAPRDLHQALEASADSTIWYRMNTNGKYCGFQAICKYCGSCSIGAWAPSSTPEWRHIQAANIMHFIKCNFHGRRLTK